MVMHVFTSWGDWFFAHVISGFVAWRLSLPPTCSGETFCCLLPRRTCPIWPRIAVLSLIPKVASYFGAHLYLPSMVAGSPSCRRFHGLAASLTIHLATNDGTHKEAIYDDWLPMKPESRRRIALRGSVLLGGEERCVAIAEAAPSAQQCPLKCSSDADVRVMSDVVIGSSAYGTCGKSCVATNSRR